MSDKENAEEYANKKLNKLVYCSCCQNPDVKQAYLDGLAEGRKTQWHDLRKNPNDLPKEHKEYWTKWDDGAYSTAYYFGDDFGTYVIAWCELPKFEE